MLAGPLVTHAGDYFATVGIPVLVGLMTTVWLNLGRRLSRIERRQGKHSRALVRLAGAQQATAQVVASHTSELDEVQDVLDQLQLATARLQDGQAVHDEFRRGLAEQHRQVSRPVDQ